MANTIDDTASYARVYQTVMTADKRRRSRSVETWTGFPIPRTLLQPIISDGQLELFRVGNPPLTASLAVGLKIPRLCRTRYPSMHDNSPLPARYQNKYDTSPALSDSTPE